MFILYNLLASIFIKYIIPQNYWFETFEFFESIFVPLSISQQHMFLILKKNSFYNFFRENKFLKKEQSSKQRLHLKPKMIKHLTNRQN
ncbi:hypothetical protein pb186bvf_014718 [Paramecium bursaria]